MAKKISKRTQKKIAKGIKKHPFLAFIALLLAVACVGVYLHWNRTVTISFLQGIIPQKELETPVYTDDELQIHFLQLGNSSPGDSTLLKVGNVEVLIDAGSTGSSAATIVPYIQEYCTDGVLEYVIATHADTDHIAAFAGTSKIDGIFESFVCQTIIDFPLTDKTTDVYQGYVTAREAEVAAGATHYTALECWNNANGAKRSYTLADGITMNFLYQKFYEEKSSHENNYSVCTLFTQGNNNYLFTGDLEFDGEESLIENNDLPKCKLFKAGHHGSATSSTENLLAEVQPEIVVVNCCSGGKYDFPRQEFIDRIAIHTQKVYVTTVIADNADGFAPMNGNIVVKSKGGEVTVECSNNQILLKDTDWFKANRTTPTAWLN